MKLEILKSPNPILKQVSKRISEINNEIRQLAGDMIETMILANGVGLAAIQVGQDLRMIAIINNDMENLIDGTQYPVLIALNPEIVEKSEETVKMTEGCLSFENVTKRIRRPKTIVVNYTDLQGKKKTVRVTDRNARIFEHEIDHLDGITLENYE